MVRRNYTRINSCSFLCSSRIFIQKFINYWSSSTLRSIIFWILAILSALSCNALSEAALSRQIHKISKTYIMEKAGFIYFILINVSSISNSFKFLCSFFVFSKWFLVNSKFFLYVNPRCLKCISGRNLTPANKNLFTFSFIKYL